MAAVSPTPSSDDAFDSKEFDYPLDNEMGSSSHHSNNNNTTTGMNHSSQSHTSSTSSSCRRSALKKPGQSRVSQGSSMLYKVHFRDVWLREYGMVLGDNPAVSHGAPVQLD